MKDHELRLAIHRANYHLVIAITQRELVESAIILKRIQIKELDNYHHIQDATVKLGDHIKHKERIDREINMLKDHIKMLESFQKTDE